MSERDFAAEMRAVIDAETSTGPYVARVVASHIVEKLRATDPGLLSGWLDTYAEALLWQAINDRDRSMRAHIKATRNAAEFEKDAKAAEGGDSEAMGRWAQFRVTCAGSVRKSLTELTREDLLFACGAYEARANENRMMAVFFKALAKKVRTGCVRDYYTDEQLTSMWQSIAGSAAA